MKSLCETCKYYNKNSWEKPCVDCYDEFINYEAKNE